MILKLKVTVSRQNEDENADRYNRTVEVASFEAESVDYEVWDVYRSAVAALTPDASLNPDPFDS